MSAGDATCLVLPELVSAQMSSPAIEGFSTRRHGVEVSSLPASLGTVDDPAYTPGRGIWHRMRPSRRCPSR
ncbi:MAG: hypothetical protein U1F77_16470 [Kiritimatiellia bacterium]